MQIELTEQEANALLELMDAGIKNQQSGGLAMAGIAMTIMQKLHEAKQATQLNGKNNELEGEPTHG